jgi:hypothetical protein
MDFIENISPNDTPLYNNLGQIGVNAGFVEYQTDTLTAAGANAFVEGAAATDQSLGTPSRAYAIVQNFQKHFWVSKRQQAIRHAGLSNMLSYQEIKRSKEIKNDLELALHRGSAVTGNTATAPNFAGMLNKLATYNTSSSGTTLTERQFNNYLVQSFATPVNLRECYANMRVKRTINGYTTNVQRYLSASAKRQVDIIEVYESEVGILGLFKSRYQLQSASDTTYGNSFVAIDPAYFKVGVLRPFKTEPLGKDGDRDRAMIVGEMTMIDRHEAAGVAVTDVVGYLP